MDYSAELVFIPATGAGHLASALEFAKLLVARDSRLSISVLVLKYPFESASNTRAESLTSSSISERIKFIDLPQDQSDPASFPPMYFYYSFYESQKPYVRDAVGKIVAASGAPRLAGFVLDMFCTPLIDVADEFGVPSYVYFTSCAGFLGLMLHLVALNDDKSCESESKNETNSDLVVPGIVNPVPAWILAEALVDPAAVPLVYKIFRNIKKKTKGILVNTFTELESRMINSLSSCGNVPALYPLGPIINLSPSDGHVEFGGTDRKDEIVAWLDEQPSSSVVFLCFGSLGSFDGDQVREIACGLERSGVRFLWSLRRPPQKGWSRPPSEYENPEEVLPEGFLDRTAGIGKVVGWAPQVAILGHPAVGGFVSHCGWNSFLESLWYGVPVAVWPLYAEQPVNGFHVVKEFGLAVEIILDYKRRVKAGDSTVKGEEIARGLQKLMERGSDLRKRVTEMSEKSRKAVVDGGSSYTSLSSFIDKVVEHVA